MLGKFKDLNFCGQISAIYIFLLLLFMFGGGAKVLRKFERLNFRGQISTAQSGGGGGGGGGGKVLGKFKDLNFCGQICAIYCGWGEQSARKVQFLWPG